MNSEHTKQIINEIAEEEGLSDKAIRLIVSSQFEGANRVITGGIPDQIETFKSVRLNAFGIFKFKPWKFNQFMKKGVSRESYNNVKRKRYDDKQ
jgi:nucleoid DNA-binding protein